MAQRFRAIISFEYEVDDTYLHAAYGTDDPVKMAEVDREQAEADLGLFIDAIREGSDYDVVIQPLPKEPTIQFGERVIVRYDDPNRKDRVGTFERIRWDVTGEKLYGIRFPDNTFLETVHELERAPERCEKLGGRPIYDEHLDYSECRGLN